MLFSTKSRFYKKNDKYLNPKTPMKNKKPQKYSLSRQKMAEEIISIFRENPSRAFNYKQISKDLGITEHFEKKFVQNVLEELAAENKLAESNRGKYIIHPEAKAEIGSNALHVTGTISMVPSGAAYLVTPDMEEDVKIAASALKHALNGDTVRVYLYARRKRKKPEGEVVEVLKRAKDRYVGTIDFSGKYAFLISDDRNLGTDIFIPHANLKGAEHGMKAVAVIDEWPKTAKSPIGLIVDILGKPGDHSTEMNAIIEEYNLPTVFPEAALHEAEAISDNIPEAEIAKRLDFREVTTFTIDPEDAKDFDDALSIRKTKKGNWEIGVHIADVTYYVSEKSALNAEAVSRSTSVYLVDRVVPMLPEKLSNHVCSLRPDEDKLTFSVIFEMDELGEVLTHKIARTIIRSNRRFTYEEVQEIIENGKGEYGEDIILLNNMASSIRQKRFTKGAISFEKTETKFVLDENGKPLSVFFKVQKDAHKLIEEFMLLANRYVAEYVGRAKGIKKTFVYRVHDDPKPDKLIAFSKFAAKFGYKIKTEGRSGIVSSMNKMLSEVKGKGEQSMLETLALRTMAKAIYTTALKGHYGLAFQHYTHFTSPIRRYPDMMVHRLLERYLAGGKSVDEESYEEICKHASEMEKRAEDAERASVKYKQVEFLAGHVGQKFEGIISGVTKWGLYVEIIENKCEGMIRLQDIKDDYYFFDEDNFQIVGQRHKQKFRLGDSVQVIVKRADLIRKQIDFQFVE